MYHTCVCYSSYQSSPPVELTEAETEYAVNVVKHIFDGHVVFQYNCTNTIPEQLLENVITKLANEGSLFFLLHWLGIGILMYLSNCWQVTVLVDASEAEDFNEIASKPLRALPYDTPGQTFVAFEKPEGVSAVGKFSNMLRFIVKEVSSSFLLSLTRPCIFLYVHLSFNLVKTICRTSNYIDCGEVYTTWAVCHQNLLGLKVCCHFGYIVKDVYIFTYIYMYFGYILKDVYMFTYIYMYNIDVATTKC